MTIRAQINLTTKKQKEPLLGAYLSFLGLLFVLKYPDLNRGIFMYVYPSSILQYPNYDFHCKQNISPHFFF